MVSEHFSDTHVPQDDAEDKNQPWLIPNPRDISDHKTGEQVQRVSEHPELTQLCLHVQSLASGKENSLCCFQQHVVRASEGWNMLKHMAYNFLPFIHSLQQDQSW